MSLPWYALHVASNMEPQVSDRLEQAGIESYYPSVSVPTKYPWRRAEKRFFPGYVFARFLLPERTPVIQIPQVISILGIAHQPVPIPESEIIAARKLTFAALATLTACPYVAAGQRVVIQRGPLQGLEGYVQYVKGAARVVVSVTMLQRSLSAEVDAADLAIRQSPRLQLAYC